METPPRPHAGRPFRIHTEPNVLSWKVYTLHLSVQAHMCIVCDRDPMIRSHIDAEVNECLCLWSMCCALSQHALLIRLSLGLDIAWAHWGRPLRLARQRVRIVRLPADWVDRTGPALRQGRRQGGGGGGIGAPSSEITVPARGGVQRDSPLSCR